MQGQPSRLKTKFSGESVSIAERPPPSAIVHQFHRNAQIYFDIFRIGGDGQPIWLETVETLELAMTCVNTLRESAASDYIILSQSTGKRIAIAAPGGIKRD
jgi:hypothetical protein